MSKRGRTVMIADYDNAESILAYLTEADLSVY